MLSPDYIAALPLELAALMDELEDFILRDVARRVAKAGKVTDTAAWQAMRLKELGMGTREIESTLAAITERSLGEIERAFTEAAKASCEFDEDLMSRAGAKAVRFADNEFVKQLLAAAVEQTQGEFKNLTRSMGFKSPGGEFLPLSAGYQRALDSAQLMVASGAVDYNTATALTVRRLADSGIRMVSYASGAIHHADVAARRALMTGIAQMTGKIAESNARLLNTNLVEVTAHSGARPDHALWQGKVYSVTGGTTEYPNLAQATGYGDGAGLKGWNCGHDFFPYIPGSPRAYTDEELARIDPPPFTYGGREYTAYEARQRQRGMERAMRATKRRLVSYDGAGLKDEFTSQSIRLRRQREAYIDFSRAAGLKTQFERVRVMDYGRSEAAKASWAVRRVEKSRKGGIINVEEKVMGGIRNIDSSIEQRNTAKGNPNAILQMGRPLNNRQEELLKKLTGFESRATIKKSEISMRDLAAMTAYTGDEFAMFTKGGERLIIRGNHKEVNVDENAARELNARGYKWSGHTHPGVTLNAMGASDGDYKILDCFNQKQSVIYNSKGQHLTFAKD